MSYKQLTVAFMALSVFACGDKPRPAVSRTKEAWDSRNTPALMGFETLRYEELTQAKALRGAVEEGPWKDDYWPFYRKNVANRYVTGHSFGSFGEQVGDASFATDNP